VYQQQGEAAERKEGASSRCYTILGANTLCSQNHKAAEAEAERSDDDLHAQQDMAEWAKWITLLTGFQVVVGAFGIYFVARTLDKTAESVSAAHESNETARRIAAAELRAYVQVSSPAIRNFVVGQRPEVVYRAKNAGQTPAFRFRNITQVKTGRIDVERVPVCFGDDFDTPFPRLDLAGGEAIEQQTLMPVLTQGIYDAFMAGERQLVFAGLLLYRDVFRVERRTIFRCYFAPETLKDGSAALRYCTRHNRGS
jgi:hypothetical protein